jgi:hydrogenase nickel incorporation protein HypA/HybF
MHELGLCAQMVDDVSAKVGEQKVARVVLEIGALSAVLPDAMRFCFDLCTQGTPLEGAALDVREVPGRAKCTQCATELELLKPFGRCACGCSDLTWLSGEELRVTHVQLQEEAR